jgi:CheY-like chemotaxis protein
VEQKRMTLGQAARYAGMSEEQLRCAIIGGDMLGEMSENTGMFMISVKALDAYMKAHNHARPEDERKRVLIIDDEINFGNLVKLDLSRDKRIVVKFASWGHDGVRLAKEFRPHVLLLDFMLPDGTGEMVLQEISDLRAEGKTKVIVYSAHAEAVIRDEPALKQRLERLGADEFISKAVGLKALVRQVHEALGLPAPGTGPAPQPPTRTP